MDGEFPNFSPPSEIERSGFGKRLLGIFFLVAIISGGATLSLLALRIWDPLWNPFRPSPEKVLERMEEEMEKVKSALSKTEISLTGKNEEEISVELKVKSKWEKIDSGKTKSEGDFSLTFSSQGKFIGGKVLLAGKTIGEDKTVFLKMTTVPELPFLKMMGIDLSQLKDEWIKIDSQFLKDFMGGEDKKSTEEEQKVEKELQEKIKKVFREKRILLVEKELEDEEIGGKKVYHYLVRVNKSEFSNAIVEILKNTEKSMLEESGATLTLDPEKFKKEILDKLGEIKGQLWIGKKDYLLYKSTFETEVELETKKGKVNFSFKFNNENSKFNQPVKITLPSEYKNFSEILALWLDQYGKFLGESFSKTKAKAKDAKIILNLTQVRMIAEMIYDNENSYFSLCKNFSLNERHSSYGSSLLKIEEEIEKVQGGILHLSCYASINSYCITANFTSPEKGKYCIDSSGKVKEIKKYQTCLGTGSSKNPYRCP